MDSGPWAEVERVDSGPGAEVGAAENNSAEAELLSAVEGSRWSWTQPRAANLQLYLYILY